MENEFMTDVSIGVEEPEVTDTAEATSEIIGEEESEVAEPTKNNEQSNEENARYAAARRRAERELAAEKERFENERASIAENAIASLGITDPESGAVIKTKSDYDKYLLKQNEKALREVAQRTGMSEGDLNTIVNNLPVVKQAQYAARQAEEAAAKIKIDKQIEEITKIDPSIKSISDLLKTETFPQFDKLVKMGHSFVDAYRYANIDKQLGKAADMSRQAALNSVNSKNHLTSTPSRIASGTTVAVPDDIKAMYRSLIPDATDAEISAHYAKTIKK